jgi:hypothetical protein
MSSWSFQRVSERSLGYVIFVGRVQSTESVFVNLLRSPGIDSQPDGPVRPPYLSYRPAMLHRQVESNPRNRFLVSLNVYKYGLSAPVTPQQIRCQHHPQHSLPHF